MSLSDIKDQVWKLYATLPQELKDAFGSEETGNTIASTCRNYDVSDQLDIVVEEVGKVLLGITPLAEFAEAMKGKLDAEPATADAVSRELTRMIFMPVKTSLNSLFDVGPEATKTVAEIKPKAEPVQKIRPGSDRYREPVE